MKRAIELARLGEGYVSPNPMVGCVVVCDDKIIGEGYHRIYGEAHAEVNAINSVKNKELLLRSTVYVTLEPCSHYGKTPPCAKLLVDMGVPRVVVGCVDPNEKVAGRGIGLLRLSGAEVFVGVLERECQQLNERFMVSHSYNRPFVLLKWAMSSDGFLDCSRTADERPPRFSTPTSMQEVHRLRSIYDAILVGSATINADNPRLDVRLFDGHSPLKVVLDRRGLVNSQACVFQTGRILYLSAKYRDDLPDSVIQEQYCATDGVERVLEILHSQGVSSVMVEGGASVLSAFVDSGLWDKARIEVSPVKLGTSGRAYMPVPNGCDCLEKIDENLIINVKNTKTCVK